MPQRINKELTRLGFESIPDVAGNEPIFARVIFESLSVRYAAALASLEKMLGAQLTAIHMLGGQIATSCWSSLLSSAPDCPSR